jgi:hypothetical protein
MSDDQNLKPILITGLRWGHDFIISDPIQLWFIETGRIAVRKHFEETLGHSLTGVPMESVDAKGAELK